MKPVNIYMGEDQEETQRKMIALFDDIYDRFIRLQENVINFDTGENLIRSTSVSTNSDQIPIDIAAHEATYDHTLLHARQHALDSTADHTSTITQNNIMVADANGLPDDSGYTIDDLKAFSFFMG